MNRSSHYSRPTDLLSEGGNKSDKNQGVSASVKFLGVRSHGTRQDSPCKGKAKLLDLVPPTIKKEAYRLVGPFAF